MAKKYIQALKHINVLLSKEEQTIGIEDCIEEKQFHMREIRECVDFLIWRMEKDNG